jgi:hypothetical protein
MELLPKYFVCIEESQMIVKKTDEIFDVTLADLNNVINIMRNNLLKLIKKVYILNNILHQREKGANIFVSSDFIHSILLLMSKFVCTKSNIKSNFAIEF